MANILEELNREIDFYDFDDGTAGDSPQHKQRRSLFANLRVNRWSRRARNVGATIVGSGILASNIFENYTATGIAVAAGVALTVGSELSRWTSEAAALENATNLQEAHDNGYYGRPRILDLAHQAVKDNVVVEFVGNKIEQFAAS